MGGCVHFGLLEHEVFSVCSCYVQVNGDGSQALSELGHWLMEIRTEGESSVPRPRNGDIELNPKSRVLQGEWRWAPLNLPHKERQVKVNAFVDEGIAPPVEALSEVRGLLTVESCQGQQGQADAFVTFKMSELTVVDAPKATPLAPVTANSAYRADNADSKSGYLVLMRGDRLEITADVDAAGLRRPRFPRPRLASLERRCNQ